MSESQVHSSQWEKPDSKPCILFDSVYMTFWKTQNYKDGKQWFWWAEWRDWLQRRTRNTLGWGKFIFWLWWLHNYIHLSKLIVIYFQKEYIVLYVNYIPIHLTFLKQLRAIIPTKWSHGMGLLSSSTMFYKLFFQLPLLTPTCNFLSYSIYRKIISCSFVGEKVPSVIQNFLKQTLSV